MTASDGMWGTGFLLEIVDGPGRGEIFELHRNRMDIGRINRTDNIRLPDPTVPRQRGYIGWDPGLHTHYVFGYPHHSPVRLNDTPMIGEFQEYLQPRALLQFGDTRLRYYQIGDDSWLPAGLPDEERLQKLRGLLYEPSRQNWEELLELFLPWRDPQQMELGLQYAQQHLESWPDALRMASLRLYYQMLIGRPTAFWPLIRSLTPRHANQAFFQRIREGHLAHITHFNMALIFSPEQLFRSMFAPESRMSLRAFRLHSNGISPEQFGDLAEWEGIQKLHTLEIHDLNFDDQCLNHFATPGAFGALKHLDITSHRMGQLELETFSRAPCLQQLESLRMRHRYTEPPDLYGLTEHLENPNHAIYFDAAMGAFFRQAEMPELRILEIDSDSSSSNALFDLPEFRAPQLESLILHVGQCVPNVLYRLLLHPFLRSLKHLHLETRSIESGGLRQLVEALPHLSLTSLVLKSQQPFAREVVDAFARCPNIAQLEHLDLVHFYDHSSHVRLEMPEAHELMGDCGYDLLAASSLLREPLRARFRDKYEEYLHLMEGQPAAGN